MDKSQMNDVSLDDDEIEIDLVMLFHDFMKILRRYWKLFVVIVLAILIAFTGYTYLSYKPMYQSSATFTVATSNEGSSYSFTYSQNTADQMSKTFPYILQSNYFKSVLLDELNANVLNGTLTAETVSESNIVTMKVTSPKAEDALNILTTAIDLYPNTARFVLGDIQFHMINNPVMPKAPHNQPSLIRTVVLGGGAGAVVGVLVLGLMAFFKKTVRSIEQMNKITSLKCLATVPEVTFKARKKRKRNYISLNDRRIPFSYKESLRSLQIRLERGLEKKNGKVIMVTSTVSGEGKTTLAHNLAETFCMNGKRILLIDADLRKPSLIRMTKGVNSLSIIEAINRNDASDFIRNSDQPLFVLGETRPVKNPVNLLNRKHLKKVIDMFEDDVDYIIIDTPPCGIFQDASIIQEYVDGVLYVVRYDYVPQQKVQEGLSSLNEDDCFMGYAFNYYDYHVNDYGYGGYGYGKYGYGYGQYGYGHKEKKK